VVAVSLACGCNIITNKFAVLGERSPNAVDDKDFIEDVIKSLQEMQQPVDTKQYIQDNSWETVARAWEKDMFV